MCTRIGQPTPEAAWSPTHPVFLFVPGAWHQAWPFDLVRRHLAARGHATAHVELATVGAADPARTGLAEDVAAIRAGLEARILGDAGEEVVVVAHSYGGIPTAGAVRGLGVAERAREGKKGGVLMVLHLGAFAVPVGTSLRDNLPGKAYPPWWNVQSDIITPIDPHRVFYADVEPALAAHIAARLQPHSLKAMEDKSAFAPWDHGFEMGYIFAEEDQAIPLAAQRAMQSQFPAGSFTASLRAGHSPFLSVADELGDVLERAAAFAVRRRDEDRRMGSDKLSTVLQRLRRWVVNDVE
ncbi:hypothetical protein PG985_009670 [Apiospora marii]|uniref:uncharacterized protein n=1 Tax=Apiospora marii TaxID=335849 RepID=UPI0031310C73